MALTEDSLNVFSNIPKVLDADSVLVRVVFVLLFFAGAASLIYLLIGGLGYVTAGGDEEKAATARKTIIFAVIGVLVTSASWLIFKSAINLIPGP